jgi:tetratricopeptide (TPR) repeat protein
MADKTPRVSREKLVKYAKIVGVLVIVGAIVWLVFVYFLQNKAGPNSQEEDGRTNLVATSEDADKALVDGNADEAVRIYDQGIANSESDQEKANLTYLKAYAFIDKGDYGSALTLAQEAEKQWQTVDSAYLLAEIYAAQGNKSAARTQYQAAIDRLDTKSQDYKTSKQLYESKIKEL